MKHVDETGGMVLFYCWKCMNFLLKCMYQFFMRRNVLFFSIKLSWCPFFRFVDIIGCIYEVENVKSKLNVFELQVY